MTTTIVSETNPVYAFALETEKTNALKLVDDKYEDALLERAVVMGPQCLHFQPKALLGIV